MQQLCYEHDGFSEPEINVWMSWCDLSKCDELVRRILGCVTRTSGLIYLLATSNPARLAAMADSLMDL